MKEKVERTGRTGKDAATGLATGFTTGLTTKLTTNLGRRLPTLALRVITVLAGCMGVVVCIFMLPSFERTLTALTSFGSLRIPLLVGLYAGALCFFFALAQFWLLLGEVSLTGVLPRRRLRNIRISALWFAALYVVFLLPMVYLGAVVDDENPGVFVLGALLDCFPIGIAAFAALLERCALSSASPASEK